MQSGKKNVSFDYDAMGRRIAKHVFDDDWMLEKSTYYVLDAQGNTLNVYEHQVDDQDVLFSLKERHIYGSSTLGTLTDSVNMYTTTPTNLVSTTLGKKFLQLGDHRGNVNTVISDIKVPVSTGTTVDYYQANIVNVADFSGFGVELDGRTIENSFYRRSFQNQEKDDEIKEKGNSINYMYRMHDPRIGRFFALDPLAPKYPHNSPYAFSENRVTDGVELEGLEVGLVLIGGEYRVTALVSYSNATDLILYFDGIFNDDPLAFKLYLVGTEGKGFGVVGAQASLHTGIWIGDDSALTGEGLTFGLDIALIGDLSFAVSLSKPPGGWEGRLPTGMMITVGGGIGAAADLYGEETESNAFLVYEKKFSNSSLKGIVRDFFYSPNAETFKSFSDNLKSLGVTLNENQMNTIRSTAENLSNNWSELRTGLSLFGVSLPSNYFDLLNSNVGKEFIYNWIETTNDQDTNNPNKFRPQYIENPKID